MATIRVCDYGDCPEQALFVVSLLEEDGLRVMTEVDCCSVEHIQAQVDDWNRTLAGLEPEDTR